MAGQITRFTLKSARYLTNQHKVMQISVRCMGEGANPDILKKQEHFQKDDGTPIYLKGGPMDQVLYRTTMGLCVFAVGYFFYNIYDMAMPKKK